MKICFYAPLKDRTAFDYNQFYAQDVRIMRSLAGDLVLATSMSEVPASADLYFVWWWSWAFVPLAKALPRRRPVVITGVFDLDAPVDGASYYARPIAQRVALRASLLGAARNVFVSQREYQEVPATLPTRGPRYAPLVVDGDLHAFRAGPREPFLLTICWLHSANPIRKGVDLAIRAHKLLLTERPELELLIAGSKGDALEGLEALVDSLGTKHRVRFLGRVSTEEKCDLLQRCAAYLQPSIHEGFGVAAAEAMASGAPVVAARVGALPEVLGDDAYWVDERTPEAVAAAVSDLLSRDTEGQRARAARRIRSQFSPERRHAALSTIVNEALEHPPMASEVADAIRRLQ